MKIIVILKLYYLNRLISCNYYPYLTGESTKKHREEDFQSTQGLRVPQV